MSPQRTVLLVAPQFPPSPMAGVHRARHMAKHLPAHGWRPIVVTPEPKHYTERLDPALAALVPLSVERAYTGAVDKAVAGRFGISDIGLRAFTGLRKTLDRLIRTEKPSAVFITGSPYYPMLLAPWIKRKYGLPVVLDFQDPWVSSYGATVPRFSKGGAAHALSVLLEPIAVRASAFVTSVSDVQNEEMADRYPWFDRSRMAGIPIGGDPEDYASVRRAASAEAGEGPVVFTYVGAYWPAADPVFRQLMRGLAHLKRTSPKIAAGIRLRFIGTYSNFNLAPKDMPRPLAAIAAQEGVSDLVEENPVRIPFVEALSTMANADVLLMVGSEDPHYTASKIYPALMSGRPWLSLFHGQSSAHAVLCAAGGGRALAFGSSDDLAALDAEIAAALAALAADPEAVGKADPAAYAPYTAHSVAGRFAEIFDRVTETRR